MQSTLLRGIFKVIISFSIVGASLVSSSSLVLAEQDKGKDSSLKPASREDEFLYRGIGALYLCNARREDIKFEKAFGMATITYVQLLNMRHGGVVASVGDKRLSNKQLFNGAGHQIMTGALQTCPKEIPKKVKRDFENRMKKIKNMRD